MSWTARCSGPGWRTASGRLPPHCIAPAAGRRRLAGPGCGESRAWHLGRARSQSRVAGRRSADLLAADCQRGLWPEGWGPAAGRGRRISASTMPDRWCSTASRCHATSMLGTPVLELEFSMDKPVAQVAVRLSDVADGAAQRASYAVFNLNHVAGHDRPQKLVPGQLQGAHRAQCARPPLPSGASPEGVDLHRLLAADLAVAGAHDAPVHTAATQPACRCARRKPATARSRSANRIRAADAGHQGGGRQAAALRHPDLINVA